MRTPFSHNSFSHTLNRFALIGGALVLTLAAQTAYADDAPAPAPPAASAPAPLSGNHYQGAVTSIDQTAKTFVIQTRFSETPLTVKTDSVTTYKAIKNVGLEGLKVGDHVIAQGQTSPDQSTVTARQIRILDADAKGKMKVSKRAATGIVATTTPTLTLTLEDGKTITVTTEGRARVMAPQDAAFSDLAVGNQVEVMGAPDGTSFSATAITITSPKPRRKAAPEATGTPALSPAPDTDTPAVPPAKP